MTTPTTQHPDREADAVRCYGDLLRSMSNAELARYLYIESNRMTEAEWLEWLDRGVCE